MNRLSCTERAQKEIESGRLWRAKEILRGNLGTTGFDPLLYESYGRVMLLTHEMVEAGRFLFLSGVRNPEYEEAISLYLYRHGANWANLIGTFPFSARMPQLSEYPPVVAAHLKDLGAPARFKNFWGSNSVIPYSPMTRSWVIYSLGCGLAVATVAVAVWYWVSQKRG